MGNTAYYTALRAWKAPYPQHWAQPEAEGRCCFCLSLAGTAWSRAGSLGRQGMGAFLQQPALGKLTAPPVSPTQPCKQLPVTRGLSSLRSAHQGRCLANLDMSFCVTRADKPLILPGRNNHEDFLSESAITSGKAPPGLLLCLPHAKFFV